MSRTSSIADLIAFLTKHDKENGTMYDFLNEQDEQKPSGTPAKNRESIPDGEDILAVIKKWAVEEGKFGPQLVIRFYFPGVDSKRYWQEETTYLTFPDRNDENDKRRTARKLAIKDAVKRLGITVKSVDDLADPSPNPVGWTVRLNKKTNGRYVNYFINKVVERTAPAVAKVEDDSVPF